jgi:hypothetical protein
MVATLPVPGGGAAARQLGRVHYATNASHAMNDPADEPE